MKRPGIKQRKLRQWRMRQYFNGWVKISFKETLKPQPDISLPGKTHFTISVER